MNDLYKLLPKVKVIKTTTPEEQVEKAKDTLREYFKTFHKRRKIKPPEELRFTLFMEPVPYLTVYRKGDEELPMNKLFFTSFRRARWQWIKAIEKWRKKVSSMTTAGSIE